MNKDFNPSVSIEQFAAFLDDNLSTEEMSQIQDLTSSDADLHTIIGVIEEIDNTYDEYISEYANDEYNLPKELLSEEFSLPIITNITSGIDNIMDKTKTYGYEPNYELENFDPDIYQGYSNTCAIRSQEIVLRDYGIMLSQEELVEYATKNNWFNPDPETGGTDKYSVGNLLDACGIETVRTENATVYDIIAELRAGHRVIVSVDADELWVKNGSNLLEKFFKETINKANDAIQDYHGVEGANHALIVAGVNVNPKDPSDIHINLIDPGTGQVCVEYNFKDFQNAWEDGNCLMVSTKEPAPYQYNYAMHQMEPSCFNTNFVPSMIEMPENLCNQFVLSDSFYDNYAEFEPVYNEDTIIDYDLDSSIDDDDDFNDIVGDIDAEGITEETDDYTSEYDDSASEDDNDEAEDIYENFCLSEEEDLENEHNFWDEEEDNFEDLDD